MKYYYLDSEKKTHGPHSLDELISLRNAALINDDTLSAAAGDNNWRPLGSVLKEVKESDHHSCSTWNKSLGYCPHCSVELEGELVPEFCPACSKSIHGGTRGILWSFYYALKNSFNYKGRATRREFWGFYLIYYISGLILGQIGKLFIVHQTTLFEKEVMVAEEVAQVNASFMNYIQEPTVAAVNLITNMYAILMMFPFLAVSVRRLHDTGRSAFPVIFACVAHSVFLSSFLYLLSLLIQIPESLLMNTITNDITYASLILLVLISGAFAACISLYLFIMMLLPSKKGANKYGPSVLYPKG